MSEFEKLLDTYKERLESCACAEIENVSAFSDVEIAELHAEELQARDAILAHVAALEAEIKRLEDIEAVPDDINPLIHAIMRRFKDIGCGELPIDSADRAEAYAVYGETYQQLLDAWDAKSMTIARLEAKLAAR